MKTRANSFFKALLMALLVPTMMISCGKKNKSGDSSPTTGIPGVGTVYNAGSGLIALPTDWVSRLYNEYPCRSYYGNNSNNRITINVQAPGPIQINNGSLHTAVTLEGDILVMKNLNNVITTQVHACERPGLTSEAMFIKEPILNTSKTCAMGEVTAADILLNSSNGVYHLAFFPAGLSSQTSLCI